MTSGSSQEMQALVRFGVLPIFVQQLSLEVTEDIHEEAVCHVLDRLPQLTCSV